MAVINGDGKTKTLRGNVNEANTINGSDLAEIIVGGKYDDTITCGRGNDTVTGGLGTTTLNYTISYFDNDFVNLTKGENLVITGLQNKEYEKSGNNSLIKSTYGTVTLKNYYTLDTGATE